MHILYFTIPKWWKRNRDGRPHRHIEAAVTLGSNTSGAGVGGPGLVTPPPWVSKGEDWRGVQSPS